MMWKGNAARRGGNAACFTVGERLVQDDEGLSTRRTALPLGTNHSAVPSTPGIVFL